jgi:hypothetical protein
VRSEPGRYRGKEAPHRRAKAQGQEGEAARGTEGHRHVQASPMREVLPFVDLSWRWVNYPCLSKVMGTTVSRIWEGRNEKRRGDTGSPGPWCRLKMTTCGSYPLEEHWGPLGDPRAGVFLSQKFRDPLLNWPKATTNHTSGQPDLTTNQHGLK